jgi:hypothetical protein
MMTALLCLRQGRYELINQIDFVAGGHPWSDPVARAVSIK